MRNLRFVVRYDGTDFYGWQSQPDQRTVQGVFEKAVQSVTRDRVVRANTSGRTDGGVHALAQVVNLYSRTRLPGHVLVRAVNANLPADMGVRACDDVPESFCANKDALLKTYRYVCSDLRRQDPFWRRYSYHAHKPLDAELMDAAAQCLVGRHDFRSFETNYPNRLSSIRTVTRIRVRRYCELVWLDIEADGFLYNMVRGVMGTLLKVGRGDWPPGDVAKALAALDRRVAGPNAPPEGLYLWRVTYPDYLALPELPPSVHDAFAPPFEPDPARPPAAADRDGPRE